MNAIFGAILLSLPMGIGLSHFKSPFSGEESKPRRCSAQLGQLGTAKGAPDLHGGFVAGGRRPNHQKG
jgi:hypothetical protein